MRTVSAKFDTYDEVTAAVDGLSDMGVPGSDITVVSRRHDAMTRIAEGVGLGAAVGGIGGLLAGFGMFIISGLGYVSGIGWLIPLLIGAAAGGVAGGVIGSFTGAGIDEKDATICAEETCRGGTLLVARVHDDEAGEARAVLLKCGAIDTNSKRSEYAADGWDGFVTKDIWDEDIGSEDVRQPEERADRNRPVRRHMA